MPAKIFALGVTGYIGGDALFALAEAHPEYEIACLVRNSDKGAQVASQHAKIRLVYGDLDDTETLEREAQKADVVLNCANADHEAAAKALTKGLASRESKEPGYYVHTSGTGILMWKDSDRKSYGEASSKIYDDWEHIGEVTSLPDHASHRIVDKIVIEAAGSGVKTAIICPPTIYGPGRGPGNGRSLQVPELARCTLERKQAFQVGAGHAYWNNVHVHDLSDLFVKLVEAATEGAGKATWGAEGYYFAENGEHTWGHVSKAVAKAACEEGLLPSEDVVNISAQEADEMSKSGAALWGANSRSRAIRASKLLGWLPSRNEFENDIVKVVADEARSLGLTTGHAAKALG